LLLLLAIICVVPKHN